MALENVTKMYPGVVALDDVSIQFKRGEVHAIVGENGAGKSTLIRIISGVTQPTSGKIVIEGVSHDALTTSLSMELGIAVVYQEFSLVPELNVTENIFLGAFIRKGWIIDRKTMDEQARALFKRLRIDIDTHTKVADLTNGYQQMVEIAKAISRNSKILIMDEPSAPLTTNEVESMFRIIEVLKQQGVTVIYISHRLEEIFRISDRVSVFRDGKYITTLNTQQTNKNELIKFMVGRTLSETYPKRDYATDETVLSVRNLSGNGVKDISFDLKRGEILGLGGLVGAGRTEFVQLLFGNAKISGGDIFLYSKSIAPRSPKKAVKLGISMVPEDRKKYGIILDMNVRNNLTLTTIKMLSRKLIVKRALENNLAEKYIQTLKIRTPGVKQTLRNLSGGNQQKVVLGKWLATNHQILIMDEPTRGIDVGTKKEIYEMMTEIVKQGCSIIMISSDMEEMIGMSDRMVILCKGRQSGILEKKNYSQERILRYSTGDNANE